MKKRLETLYGVGSMGGNTVFTFQSWRFNQNHLKAFTTTKTSETTTKMKLFFANLYKNTIIIIVWCVRKVICLGWKIKIQRMSKKNLRRERERQNKAEQNSKGTIELDNSSEV